MKHLVIHLISLILLIVLFLALLDEIGSKTAGDKQLQEASAQIEQLTAERDYEELNFYILNAMLKG